VIGYDNRDGRYRIRLDKSDVKKHSQVLKDLFETAYRDSGRAEL